MIEFKKDDRDSISIANSKDSTTEKWIYTAKDAWNLPKIKSIKKKIKNNKLERCFYFCCYCGVSLHTAHGLTIDIEHILPKSHEKFRRYMFTSKNLSVSCKTCNMTIKNKDFSFVILSDLFFRKPFQSRHYKIIHPNLDNPNSHLERDSHTKGRKIITTFNIKTNKGKETYSYFNLSKDEINTIDKSQGIKTERLNQKIPSDLQSEINQLLDGRGEF